MGLGFDVHIKLTEGISIKRDPLAPHPRAHISDPLLGRPGISVELHDYLRIEFSHGCHKWCPAPAGYLSLEVRKLIVPQLDLSLFKERPSLNGLKMLLVFRAPEPVTCLCLIFLEAISYEDTFVKSIYMEITF